MLKKFAELEKLSIEHQHKQHPNYPKEYLTVHKYTDATSNGLTKCIIDWIRFNGGQAERINTTGRYVQGGNYIDVIGRTRLTKGKYIPTAGAVGSADISAIIFGKSVKIEVKIGKDMLSNEQFRYKKEVEAAGGIYIIAKTFENFLEEYHKIINDCV